MLSKEFNIGDTAHIGRNMRVKFLDGDTIKVKKLCSDAKVKVVGVERIEDKCGKYGYYIEYDDKGTILKSTHTISQFDFYSKYQWCRKLEQDALINSLINR